MQILITEDDLEMAGTLQHSLEDFYSVIASNAEEAVHLYKHYSFDCCLLDINLPDLNGIKLCRILKDINSDVPIIIVSGDLHLSSKLNAFGYGIDDYVTKPFHIEELKARIQAVINRKNEYRKHIQIADLILDYSSRNVKRASKSIYLSKKEFNLLEFLMKNKGKVLSREMIMNNIWQIKDSMMNTVDVHINYLRNKIDKPYKHKLIKTIYGFGYTIDGN